MLKHYYFDNAATTKTRPEVFRSMKSYLRVWYGNPSSTHKHGTVARGSIEMARERIASILVAEAGQLVFTGSGSEGNNTAIFSSLKLYPSKRHIISSRIEHSSIFNTLEGLRKENYEITYIQVDSNGKYDLDELKKSIRKDTALISLSYANNEIGTIQDAEKISEIVSNTDALLHLDAVQALPYIKINLKKLNADFVVFSGHKLYAPKGIGLLYIKDGSAFSPLIYGGGQEFNLRSGTENVPYIMGLSKAIELNYKEKDAYNKLLVNKRDRIIKTILKNVDGVVLTGDSRDRISNLASFAVKGINGKSLVKKLSPYNIEISSGSACTSGKKIPSRVLDALGYSEDLLSGSIRISLGKYNTFSEVKYLLKHLIRSIKELQNSEESHELDMSYISQTKLQKKVEGQKPIQIIDLRFVSQPKMDMPGVHEIPIWKLKKGAKRLNKDIETIVSCYNSDMIAPQGQATLINMGFKSVKVLNGGYYGFTSYMQGKKSELKI